MGSPGSPRSPLSIPNSTGWARTMGENAVAGPSSEGAHKPSRDEATFPPKSPSSAPPTPSVISVTHPSQYIHTHHPRRGSMTPLGLNLISPVPPTIAREDQSFRTMGFQPSTGISPPYPQRRGSTASTTSTLTQSRPPVPQHNFYPPNWNPGRRRSSLTPSAPSLAAASPTRAHASGKISRPVSGDGVPPVDVYARRGSLPHLGYGGGQRSWNPVLPPPRGSVDHEEGYSGFKFGSGGAYSPGRRASLKRKEDLDAFEQTEEEEADRQRRAFLAATYGADGKRARERLSIGGQSGQGPPISPNGGLRRQSLLLWERMGRGEAGEGPSSAPPHPSPLSPHSHDEDLGQRRGSLPIAIPGGGGIARNRVEISVNMEEEDDDDPVPDVTPVRPLPPLLPLSDPGPRLLPSTLALHRANHLLQSRNLHSDPLPHPLPPSLHPPNPVDVAEFDIDFILAGSQAQLGGQNTNTHVDANPPTTTLKLGGDEEDTFAKFVGQFDDEYGDRRGEWTFRSCPTFGLQAPLDPLDKNAHPKAEWESTGAGRYELFPNGEVKSSSTGRSWRVMKLGNREYELEEVSPIVGERIALAGKTIHRDQGGVKLPNFRLSRASPKPIPERNRLDSHATMTPHLSRQRSKDEGKKERGIGNVLKRGFFSSIKHTNLGSSSEEKKFQREERERERAQAHSWGGASNIQNPGQTWFSGSARGSDSTVPIYRSSKPSASNSSSDDSKSAPWSSGEAASSATSGEEHRSIRWREGIAWQGVPDEAVAMIIPLDEIPATRPSLTSRPPESHPFFAEGPKQALLVWYVPFNSEYDDFEARPSTASSKASISEPSASTSTSASTSQVGSLPKLQKLLRRRASKDKEALRKEAPVPSPQRQGPTLPPLPFRSFRVVARVINTNDLRSEEDSVAMGRSKSASPFGEWTKEQDVFLSTTSAGPTSYTQPSQDKTTQVAMTGRYMPTVIAVCHSRSQGVEFVLEGLDRLGLCKGESAWGPTGYEEWRGTGLSDKGRELLDILWAGCTGVMGLSAL